MPLDGLRAVASRKITHYLLRGDHAAGGPKDTIPALLENALLRHPLDNNVVSSGHTLHGFKSVVRCNLHTPDGRNPCIITVWLREDGSRLHRLVTAYPA